MNDSARPKKSRGLLALSPLAVFLCLYLGTSLAAGDFYKVPIAVAFLAASVYSVLISRGEPLTERIRHFTQGASHHNLMLMIWIFVLAGAFARSAEATGAIDATVGLTLRILPGNLLLGGLFLAGCFISLAVGTSVGTIVALTPVALGIAQRTGLETPMIVAVIVGGSFFGDNLSFISDTTIAACQGQGCQMKDKFRENFKIALPAALVTLVIILVLSLGTDISGTVHNDYNLLELIPYLIVLVGGIVGINVFIVLLLGILSGSIIVVAEGAVAATDLLGNMGTGAAGMFETTMVAVLVSAICALIRENGGFVALLNGIKRLFRSRKGGQLGMGLLVGAMDIATANNTVAIVMANPIAHEMAETYNVSRRKTASILDTFSCVFQGVIPYGAQMLVAISACTELGFQVSAFQIMPFLFYPFFLLISSLVFIFFLPDDRGYVPDHAAARMEAAVGAAEGAAGDK